jgi:hypothetical protein
MTFSTLTQIERCPRQWALSNAAYPYIWGRKGYPQRMYAAAFEGQVLHKAVEIVLGALTAAGCASLQEPSAFGVMKSLGGYTAVVDDSIRRVIGDSTDNPRASRVLESAERRLRARLHDLRARVQTIVSRVSFAPPIAPYGPPSIGERRTGAITAGAFAEVDLSVPELSWKGRVDLLVVSADGCEITDFKTGKEDPKHILQIQIYALLWSLDRARNPGAQRVRRLVLAYSGRDKEVSVPTTAQLGQLRNEIAARSDAARQAVAARPPEARPTQAHCDVCGVRHLCGDYWQRPDNSAQADDADRRSRIDLQVTIVGQHGPWSWDATIERAPGHPVRGRRALIRTAGDVAFSSGSRVRILDADVQNLEHDELDGQEPDAAIVMLNASSEVYASTSA